MMSAPSVRLAVASVCLADATDAGAVGQVQARMVPDSSPDGLATGDVGQPLPEVEAVFAEQDSPEPDVELPEGHQPARQARR